MLAEGGDELPFKQSEVDELLVQCHRRCCICHRFCGLKMETDHIVPKDENGSDEIDNAIPLCFECHAEVHAYNNKHPRGRKYHSAELRQHKNQWLEICRKSPQILVDYLRIGDPGPLSSLLSELEYNELVSTDLEHFELTPFEKKQFDRAIAEGIISLADEDLADKLMRAYAHMNKANLHIESLGQHASDTRYNEMARTIADHKKDSRTAIVNALEGLRAYLERN